MSCWVNDNIIVYKAYKQRASKESIVSKDELIEYVKNYQFNMNMMDVNFCRSNPNCHFDIYSRFSNNYDAGFKLQSGAYIIAWRR